MKKKYTTQKQNKTETKLKRTIWVCLLLVFFSFNTSMFAQGADCLTATPITINGACLSGTISNTPQDAPTITGCTPGTFRTEGWYTFTVTGGPVNITISASISNNRNLYIQLISSSSSCTGLANLACANATTTNGAQTETMTQSLANGIYYIKLVNVGTNGNMTLTSLCVTSPCTTPVAQPTSLVVNPLSNTSISGSFTAASPAPSGYMVVRSTSATAPTPTNGTNYAVGNTTLTPGTTNVIQNGTGLTFTDTGLTGNTKYYYYVYSYNNSCTGAPNYNSVSPLTNNAITCPASATPASTASITGTGFTINWTAPTGGAAAPITYTLQVTTDSGYTTNIAGSPFTIAAPTTSQVITGLNSGTIYYYRILANNGCNSSYVLGNVTTTTPAPANNQCSNATNLPCGTTNLAGTTLGAVSYTTTTGCTLSSYGVWYTFVGDGTQSTITVTTTAYDVELAVASGSCGSLTNITCQDTAFSNGTETAVFNTTSGVTYYVYVAYYTTGATLGNFTISRSCTVPFNPCATIPTIATCGTTTNLSIPAGTGAYGSSSCGFTTPGIEQIYSFTPTITGSYSIQQINSYSYIDYMFKPVSSGCNGTGWTCISDISGAGSSGLFTLTAGTAYYILLDPESTLGGNVTFSINCPAAPMTNDNCANAIPLTVNSICSYSTFTNAGATASPGIPAPGCANYSGGDVWFSVVVPSTGNITITSQTGTMSDGGMAVYSGTCGALTLIQCNDDNVGLMPGINLTGQTAGATLWVRFWEYGNDNNGTFGLCVTTTIPCTAGTGTGTTSLECPAIASGGIGLSGADPLAITCPSGTNCTTLEASYPQYNLTTDYTVTSIPYAPPYQFNCLQNPISINVDDVWSPIINLPFNFCYFGNNYNKCVVGSNGTISFDTVTNAPGGYSAWSFTNNLPSATLFLNTIFGVYHDIDPSKGGEVGWELITLNTGCRALVASWSNVPMYSNNSIKFTGMIVLYENTSVIDVYIQEKNIDNFNIAPWNDGNAIVGIQNASGSQAVVAPGRNGQDTNWTITNEAWRFTPAGSPITSIKWFLGAGTSGTVLGTSDTLNVCPTSTTVYTAEVSYSFCSGIIKETDQTTVTVTIGKSWNGSIDSDWNKANNWTPSGVPTNLDCIVIPDVTNDPIISGSSFNAYCNTITILSGGNLVVNAGNTITVTDFVAVNAGGTFTVKNSASLIQVNNNASNTGSITMERTTNMTQLDYVYWSSPVANFSSADISPTSPAGYIFKWNPTYANPNGSQGYWVPGTETMSTGSGYIVIGPSSFSSSTSAPFTATFSGVPNNGIIQPTISRGSYTGAPYVSPNLATVTNLDDNWNLLGNPYPSAIDALSFLSLNSNINGNIRLWTHGSTISAANANPFYGSYSYNYNANDYVSYNGTGSTPPGFNGKIGAGQGFFVIMNDGAASSSTATFNNSLRSNTYSNSQFYKTTNTTTSETNPEKNRIWLSLVNTNAVAATTLIGYIPGATYSEDRIFDASHKPTTELGIYSWINNKTYIINGRPMPFDDTDFVPLGITLPSNGNFTIAINEVDGLFLNETQNIYLEDTYTNTIHNLRQTPYTFTSTIGNYENRFILRYRDTALNTVTHTETNCFASISNHMLSIQSSVNIEKITLYDVDGKLLQTYTLDGSKKYFEDHFLYARGVYLAVIKLANNEIETKKILH